MTDHTLARADEVLTDLVDLIETARSLPMSSSCVVPRERTLDLLDALREVLPPELSEARRVVATRERLLAEAAERAEDVEKTSIATAEERIAQARIEAESILAAARAEYERLVAADTVHRAAEAEAARIRDEATADADSARTRARDYSDRLAADAHSYAERTLTELLSTLTQLSATAENGRAALAARTPAEDEPEPGSEGWAVPAGAEGSDTPVFVDPADPATRTEGED